MITDDERRILQFIHETKHPTTEQIHRLAFPDRSLRWVEAKLKGLYDLGLIRYRLLYAQRGGGSPRYYYLLKAGGKMIGLETITSNYYRAERREFFQRRSATLELTHMAQRQGWTLLSEEHACRDQVRACLYEAAKAQHGTVFPDHTIAGLLPSKIRPDLVLVTQRESVLVIIAHPYGGLAFWRERVVRYQRVLGTLRAIAIPLTAEQQLECAAIVEEAHLTKRVLVLTPEQLAVVEQRLV